jgi:hypothetical protein
MRACGPVDLVTSEQLRKGPSSSQGSQLRQQLALEHRRVGRLANIMQHGEASQVCGGGRESELVSADYPAFCNLWKFLNAKKQ